VVAGDHKLTALMLRRAGAQRYIRGGSV